MSVKYTFLLVGETGTRWHSVLQRVLSSLSGKLHTVAEERAAESVAQDRYDMVIVDAGIVDDAALLVSHLRARQKQARVVVATASPTWKRARAALQAGAADYISTSLNEDELRSVIEMALKLPPSFHS